MTPEERQADRERRAIPLVIDHDTMPQRMTDALLDLQDVVEDFHEFFKRAVEPITDEHRRELRRLLVAGACTLQMSAQTMLLAHHLYAETDLMAAKGEA